MGAEGSREGGAAGIGAGDVILNEPHRDAVASAISRVLSTEIAEITYAQIVDGLPLLQVFKDVHGHLICLDHPIHQHTQLKDNTLDTVRQIRNEFNPNILQFDIPLLSAFQAASPGSRAFGIRLIEIIAISVHQVAVLLYQNNSDLSTPGSALQLVHTRTPPKDDYDGSLWWRFNRDGPPATLFRHTWYRECAQYPHGAADVAGYWAENRGGAREGSSAGSDAVYLHPDRDEVTYRICLLTDAQKMALLDFLLDTSGTGSTCPLPIIPDETNMQRVDPEEPIEYTSVYRDQWERKMPPPLWMGDGRDSCVHNPLDFPTKMDQDDARSRLRSRGDRRGHDHDGDDDE
ncbi:hypothetical protein INS49_007454 [Diaporthe citri]|uniref:uncharacterized protein n=1 Tax=Diaporthe citri TaxID=83186 RepID=UPI001C7F5249|nr:uncharacterized protein INS49_007454 [Diaporthe citri]KAG6353374.1 hypothetical protein INS49_007454 [Diaporthe citri]